MSGYRSAVAVRYAGQGDAGVALAGRNPLFPLAGDAKGEINHEYRINPNITSPRLGHGRRFRRSRNASPPLFAAPGGNSPARNATANAKNTSFSSLKQIDAGPPECRLR
jgi:hypothetical protein